MKEKDQKELNVTEEEIKKKFRSEIIGIEVFETLLIFLVIGIVLVASGSIAFQPHTSAITFFNDFLNHHIVKEFSEVIVGEKLIGLLGKEVGLALALANCIIVLAILYNIKRIFKEISETSRPFSETIIKRMERISYMVWIIWIISGLSLGIGLIAAITVSTLVYVFKYGYKLQIESDETL